MHPVPSTRVFTRADLRALGWTDTSVSRAALDGRLVRVRPGVFTRGEIDPVVRALAAARACRGSVISHRSAALLDDVPLLDAPPRRPDLTVSPSATGDLAGALLHRATLWPGDVDDSGECPVTSALRTAADLARCLTTAAAVVSLDAMLHENKVRRDELVEYLRRCHTWPGTRRARRALGLVDARSESPLESVSRLVIARLGLPRPRTQCVIRDEHGRYVGRCDFWWEEFGVAGEADGRSKYDKRQVLTDEKERQEDFEDLGVVVTRWGWEDAWRSPVRLRDRLCRAFERGTARDVAGIPRRWTVDDE